MVKALGVTSDTPNKNLPLDPTTSNQTALINGLKALNTQPLLWLKPDAFSMLVSTTGKLQTWFDALNPDLQFAPTGGTPPSVINEAVCSFTGAVTTAGGVATLVVSAVESGTLHAGSVGLSGYFGKILSQISGTNGGAGSYILDTPQTVASTAMTASAFSSLSFSSGSGQRLLEINATPLIPASGNPGTIMALVYLDSTTYGGGIFGSTAAYSSPSNNPMICFTSKTGAAPLQFQVAANTTGNVTMSTTSNYASSSWHAVMICWSSPSAGGVMYTDGAADGTGSANVGTLSTAAGAQQLVIGDYGDGIHSTSPGTFKCGAEIILPVDLSASANAAMRAQWFAELATYKTQLTS